MFCATASKLCSEFALMKKSILRGEQQHAVVHLRAARHDGDVEAVFLVRAVRDRLIEAAMLGLGDPVGAERDLVERLGLRRSASGWQARGRTACGTRGESLHGRAPAKFTRTIVSCHRRESG